MVALGCALLFEPRILLVDELSLGLAPLVVQRLLDVLRALREAGQTMVVVEQSLAVAARLTDRVLFVEKGAVRFDGAPEELTADDELARAVFLGGPPERGGA
jgi:ABC-type branched-subunit amino acid transport system ATPase component